MTESLRREPCCGGSAKRFSFAAERIIPDSFVFCVVLMIFVFIVSLCIGKGPVELLTAWWDGLSSQFTLAFQMGLMVIVCATCARSPQSASVTNLFIPSQGGQFTVQGPLIVSAVEQIKGSNLINCLNAFVLGDECTNLLQPLYVIPALSVVGMKLKDIWGFMAFICVFWIIIVCLGLYFIPLIL